MKITKGETDVLADGEPVVELQALPKQLIIWSKGYRVTFTTEDTEHLRRLLT